MTIPLLGERASAQTTSTAPPATTETGTGLAKTTQPVDLDQDPLQQDSNDLLADPYQPKGIDLGQFLLLPSLALGETFNTNIYATPNDEKSDLLTTIAPKLDLRSRFTEHELDAQIEAEHVWYARYSANDVTNVRGLVNGRYDLSRDTSLTLGLRAYSDHEDRGSNDTTQGISPTPTQGAAIDLGAETHMGPYTVTGNADIARFSFDNVATSLGTVIDDESRDRTEYSGTLRGAYEITPGYAAVLTGSVNHRDYDSERTFGENRDSTGYTIEGGLGVDITNVLRGDLLGGYIEQDYNAPLESPSGPTVKAVLNWTPSKITLVVPAIERSVIESTILGASGLIRTSYSVLVRHEYARNVLLRGFAGYYHDDYPGTGGHTDNYALNGQITYAFMPELDLTALAGYTNKSSTFQSLTYDQVVTTLTLALRF